MPAYYPHNGCAAFFVCIEGHYEQERDVRLDEAVPRKARHAVVERGQSLSEWLADVDIAGMGRKSEIIDPFVTPCCIYIMLNHRTQIYLEQGQYEVLRARARREGKSLASLIREALDEYLGGKGSRGRENAWQLFARHRDKEYDLIDCLSFSMMERFRIRNAFGFDRHFVQYGFQLVPG